MNSSTGERRFGVSNALIVESKNDKCFVEALISHLNLPQVEIQQPICAIDDYECLNGLDLPKLSHALEVLRNKLLKRNIEKIGILLDDDGKRTERIALINQAIKVVFATNKEILNTGELITLSSNGLTLQLVCFLTNVGGHGELETVLKTIKAQPSTYADCLESWRNCLKDKNETISDKEFNKFWVNNYLRFDTCTKEERKRAGEKCSMHNFAYVMQHKPDIWNFDDPVLDELKAFLRVLAI